MKKRLVAILLMVFVLVITGCGNSNRSEEEPIEADGQMAENIEQTDTEENISTEGVADYPAAIMVNDTIYLLEGGIAVLYNNEWYLGTPDSKADEPDRTISLKLDNGIWEVVNEGY